MAATENLQTVVLTLCDACLDGTGGECHTPGCALWISTAPDIPLRDRARHESEAAKVTVDHPALVLLADALRATSGPARPEDIAKLLGHALTATGYALVRIGAGSSPTDGGSPAARTQPRA
jgi:hypothetical protein